MSEQAASALSTGTLDGPSQALRFSLARFLLLACFVLNALYAATSNSGVCDELGAHIPAGYLYWTSGEFSGGLSNFPLGQLLISAPVYWLGHAYELYTEDHLVLFRLSSILLGTLLAVLVCHLTTRLHGPRAGLAALFFYALSPNILAHSSLGTLDLPAAFFVFLTIYCLAFAIERPSPLRVTALALSLGAALTTKIQAVALLALIPAVVLLMRSRLRVPEKPAALFVSLALAPLLTLAVIDACYLHWPSASAGWWPAQYADAMVAKLSHGSRGHFGYLLGEYSTSGWWYYFPVAIALKTPLPTLLLAGVGLLRRPTRASIAFVLAPILLFLGVGVVGNVDIGLRHVLLLYPFLFVLVGRGATALLTTRPRRLALAVLAAGYLVQAIFISPHHLSYFNVMAGGPARGHRYLIDSNYDWGQNDRFLRRYLATRDTPYLINPDPFQPSQGRILVNTNAYYGVLNGGRDAYRWLDGVEPVNQIAYTWFEFDVPSDEVLAESDSDDGITRGLVEHLFSLQDRYSELSDVSFRLLLAQAFSSLRAHDVAFAEIRGVIADDPTSGRALATGGELIVRYKLGVLPFRADEYLTGARTLKPTDPVPLAPESLVSSARRIGLAAGLSRLHGALGGALARTGRRAEARAAFQTALRLDENNQFARKSLTLLR